MNNVTTRHGSILLLALALACGDRASHDDSEPTHAATSTVEQPANAGVAGRASTAPEVAASAAGAAAAIDAMRAAAPQSPPPSAPTNARPSSAAGAAAQPDHGGMPAADPGMPPTPSLPQDEMSADEGQAPADADRGNALSEAYAALTRGERASVPTLVAALDQQVAAAPDDGYAVFYAGAFRLWQLAESLDVLSAPGVLDNLERAHAMLPDDFRVTGFFGLSQVLLGGLGDPELLEQGLDTLEHGIEQQSTYGHFLRATAVSTLASSHPAFQTALSDMEAVGPDCQVEVDAEGVYHYPTDSRPSRSRICTNDGIVPHAWEGYFLSFGDIALKSGVDAERVRAIYRSARTAPTYDAWPYKQLLEARIEDADRNASALGDPPVWASDGYICVGCHQKE